MWKIVITYSDKSKCRVTGQHKDIPLDLAVKYYNEYVADHVVFSAVYQQYPVKEHPVMELRDKIEELKAEEQSLD